MYSKGNHVKMKYLYMLLMFLWCAYTAPFLKPFDADYLPTSILYMVVYVLYWIKFCNNQSKKAPGIMLGVMACWYVMQCVKVGKVTGLDFRLIYSIILCHVSFYLYRGKEFFLYMEKVLVHLTLLSLVVWALGMFVTGPMQAFVRVVSVWENGSTTYGNMIVTALGNQWENGILRNIGFTWEAGRFASFLVIGLFNNLLIHNFELKRNKALHILMAGLVTTFSTTGIGAAVGVLLFYFYNKSAKMKVAIVVLCVLLLPSVFALEFVGEKLKSTLDVEKEIKDMEYSFYQYGTAQITPQRFTGLYLDFQNWMHDFWLGYNLNENSYAESVLFSGFSVWVSDGIIQIFSKYGFLVGLFFYWNLFKSSERLAADFNHKGKYIFALVFLLISVSYDFWSSAIMLHYVLYSLYARCDARTAVNSQQFIKNR